MDDMPGKIEKLRVTAADITARHIAPLSENVDAQATWPAHSLRELAQARLTGLHVPERLGGQGQGLLALAVITETIARGCSSSAMCYAMHCVGTAVIAAKATPYHEEKYLRPIAEGRHITSLALSEAGTGAHFYLPQTSLKRDADDFIVSGAKHFVTSGGYADSYVISTLASDQASTGTDAGEFNCLLIDAKTAGLEWQQPWRGFGMRGNSSCAMRLADVRVPRRNLLGVEGDQIWYVFEVVAPYFLVGMAGTYVGIAQAALDETVKHIRARRHDHSGRSLADVQVLQHHVAEMWIALERTRALVYRAARLGDSGDTAATQAIMAAKVEAADMSVWLANEAMTRCGGIAYRDNSVLGRCLRDARASHVMSPTTEILKLWIGRGLLGLPYLD